MHLAYCLRFDHLVSLQELCSIKNIPTSEIDLFSVNPSLSRYSDKFNSFTLLPRLEHPSSLNILTTLERISKINSFRYDLRSFLSRRYVLSFVVEGDISSAVIVSVSHFLEIPCIFIQDGLATYQYYSKYSPPTSNSLRSLVFSAACLASPCLKDILYCNYKYESLYFHRQFPKTYYLRFKTTSLKGLVAATQEPNFQRKSNLPPDCSSFNTLALYTQPLYLLNMLSIAEMSYLYSRIVGSFSPRLKLLILPHPSDTNHAIESLVNQCAFRSPLVLSNDDNTSYFRKATNTLHLSLFSSLMVFSDCHQTSAPLFFLNHLLNLHSELWPYLRSIQHFLLSNDFLLVKSDFYLSD